MQINAQMRILNFDLKNIYVKLPIKYTILAPKFWLYKNINDMELIELTLHMLRTIM